VVAGQDAQAAGVDGQAFGQAVLQREVGDDERSVRIHEPRMAVVVLATGLARLLERRADVVALQRAGHDGVAELVQQQDGVLPRRLP
jgi:hypothetical protein